MNAGTEQLSRSLTSTSVARLIGRDPKIVYTAAGRGAVAGRTILVTGAGGSIGREIVRQLSTLGPAKVFLLDQDEGALHSIQLELTGNGLFTDDTTILADIRDKAVLRDIFAGLRPQVVFHAAAYKHLPLLERYPAEGVKTNVLGTANVVAAAAQCGVERLVNVSTDKAAAPTSMLGATKRLAEMVSASWASGPMKIASVRFGNVLGSRGSFLPTLAWQIRNGLPVTVTDPRVTRFFMTIPEAASLVIEAAAMAQAGETYLLDMGKPIRIVDLITQYTDWVGSAAPKVVYTGLRPGEKLHEELLDAQESRIDTPHPRIWRLTAHQPHDPLLRDQVLALSHMVSRWRADELRQRVWELLPGEVATSAAPTTVSAPMVASAPTTAPGHITDRGHIDEEIGGWQSCGGRPTGRVSA